MTSSTPAGLAQARTPFEFKAASHLLFIEREQATNLGLAVDDDDA